MKRKLYLFTGFGFIGLNILNYLKNDKFKLNIIGRKKKFPFKIFINKKKFNIINQNIFNIQKLKNLEFTDSIVILSTLNSNNKNFQKKFKKLVTFLSEKKLRKIILISSVSIYGNSNIRNIQLNNQYLGNISTSQLSGIPIHHKKNLYNLITDTLFFTIGTIKFHDYDGCLNIPLKKYNNKYYFL